MRIVVQRAKNAKCIVNGIITGQIEYGYMILVGFSVGDNAQKLSIAAKKLMNLRIFEDNQGKMNLNINQVNGEILSISQFTLYADTNNGNRPSFTQSMNPLTAKQLYLDFNNTLRQYNINVAEGIFGEHMDIAFTNDGPVTIILEF